MSEVNHIDNIISEFKEFEESKAWHQMYQKVRVEGNYDLDCSAAVLPKNKSLNRYKDVLPYDHSRVILQGCETDYINASLLEVEKVKRRYILAQGPLPHTTPHFWLMIWQENTKGIVMLNKVMEKNQIKCHQYWPLGEKRGSTNSFEFSTVNLRVELLKESKHSHYVYRTFRLSHTVSNESREVFHFHYTTWPDFGVPQSPDAFFKFLSVVRATQSLEPSCGPAVIHCSAGIGRSGTFCLVDSILLMLNKELNSSKPVKVLDVLLEMRKFRMGLIQTSDQLKFSYQAILYGASKMSETNGKGPDEESECSSEEPSIDEPPPLPPPRTDSLTRSTLENSSLDAPAISTDEDDTDDSIDEDILNADLSNSISHPLPSEPSPVCDSESNSSPKPSENNHDDERTSELRRRRLDRIATTTAKVTAIKEKAKAAEDWEDTFSQLRTPMSICAALVFVGVGASLLYYYRQIHTS